MRLARFWTRAESQVTSQRGKQVVATARGWSNDSLDEARARALEIAAHVAQLIATGEKKGRRYAYGDRPLPEPVLRQFSDDQPNGSAVVTRNQYGAEVLNTDRLMFVDIDRPEPEASLAKGLLSSLFGKRPTSARDPNEALMENVASVMLRHNLSGRMYQTKGGFRVLITSVAFIAGSPEAEGLLNEFGSDPLYVRLCKSQECFRARLTPKPWRCRLTDPPVSFPFEDARAQERFARWQAGYDARRASFATCSFLSDIGPKNVATGFDPLIAFHDTETKATSSLQLA